ncbi:MAG: hypothetical protein SF187_17070 [Deltaproteobacteria bacterium]|nr:hypothetical protein [Deltaproteobacteria bacterium]
MRFDNVNMLKMFPPEHPDTPWLLRLMIIRDDIGFEMPGIFLPKEPTIDDFWKLSYFQRRVVNSLYEARHVFVKDVLPHLKHSRSRAVKARAIEIANVVKAIDEEADFLKPLRNAVGGHVEPKNARTNTHPDVESAVVNNLRLLSGTITIGCDEPYTTSFRSLSRHSLMFACPAVDDDEKLKALHDRLRRIVYEVGVDVAKVIDFLILRHAIAIGAVQAPKGFKMVTWDPNGRAVALAEE